MEIVLGGKLLDKFKSVLSKIGDMFKNMCEDLSEDGFNCTNYKEDKNGVVHFEFKVEIKSDNEDEDNIIDTFRVDGTPVEGQENVYDIKIWANGKKVQEAKNIKILDKKSLKEQLKKYISKKYGDQGLKAVVTGSKQIKISLKKVTGSKDTKILLQSVLCGNEIVPADAIGCINDICNDDTFVNDMPENETCYFAIDDCGDDLDVNPCEQFNTNQSLCSSLDSALSLLFNAESLNRYIMWNCTERDTKCYAENLDWTIREFIRDTISIIKRLDKSCGINIRCCECSDATIESVKITLSSAYDTLDLYYPNFDHVDQTQIDKIMLQIKSVIQEIDTNFQSIVDQPVSC